MSYLAGTDPASCSSRMWQKFKPFKPEALSACSGSRMIVSSGSALAV
jgi:hypothetical protein